MSDETRRVLELLAQGKITVDEADQLLRAVGSAPAPEAARADGDPAKTPRFIRIAVHKPAGGHDCPEDVNIRVPIAMVKGGMQLGAMIPGFVGERVAARLRERGLDFSKLDQSSLDAALRSLSDVSIDVDSGKAQVRITCE